MVNPLGLEEPREVPPKIWYPIVDHGTLEDDDFLRTKYAALLANAVDPSFEFGVRPAFVEILKQLDPVEAKILDDLYVGSDLKGGESWLALIPRTELDLILRNNGINDRTEAHVTMGALMRQGLIDSPEPDRPNSPESIDLNWLAFPIQLSNFGYAFVAACQPPQKA